MSNRLNLHSVLRNSYDSRDKQRGAFKNEGYVFDSDLSNDNQQVYFNPKEKKLVMSVAGTHNLRDVGTDLWLAAGKLKDTNRYKEGKSTLEKAKKRYGVDNATLAAHSLGGAVAQYIASGKDKVHTLDKGATIGQKTTSNENAYRTSGDAVSLLNARSTRMKTLSKVKPKFSLYNTVKDAALNYGSGGWYGRVKNVLTSHDVDQIKDKNIFI